MIRSVSTLPSDGKVYWGYWPLRENESGPDYLKRLYGWAERGCLIPLLFPAVNGDDFESVEQAAEHWYGL